LKRFFSVITVTKGGYMKKIVLLMSFAVIIAITGTSYATWVGGTATSYRVCEVFIMGQNYDIIQFALKDQNNNYVNYRGGSWHFGTTTDDFNNRLFTIAKGTANLNVGDIAFKQMYAQLLSAMQTRKWIGFECDLPTRYVVNLSIYDYN
jgi:hypothetical protein